MKIMSLFSRTVTAPFGESREAVMAGEGGGVGGGGSEVGEVGLVPCVCVCDLPERFVVRVIAP